MKLNYFFSTLITMMNQSQRMTNGLAAVMQASFSQRVQAFSGMTDDQLQQVKKAMSENYTNLAAAHVLERQSYAAASALKSQLGSLSKERAFARGQLSATPWYRPFKKASLKSSIASTEARIASVNKQYVSSNAASILASKRGAELLSPQMKQSNVVMNEINQTLAARQEARATHMRIVHQARVNAHNQRQAEEQITKDRQVMSFAMKELHGTLDDMREFSEQMTLMAIEEIELIEIAEDQERERPNMQHRSRPRGG